MDKKKKQTISRSYQRTMPHSLYGGADYASTKLMATYSKELDADAKEEKVKEESNKLQKRAKEDVQKSIEEEAKRISSTAEISDKQRQFLINLLDRTGASLNKPVDEITKEEASDYIDKLKEMAEEQGEEEEKKEKPEPIINEDGNEVPF